MQIPYIIHQTWKTDLIPDKWLPFTERVRRLNPDWEYKLWTDQAIDVFAKQEFPAFYTVFAAFPKNIMRIDVIRYLIMHKIGGVYLDLDYEVLEPFDFGNHQVILPLNRSLNYGDPVNEIGNSIIASVPGHQFWSDVIHDLSNNPPVVNDYLQVLEATGPGFLTRIYNEHQYADIYVPERIIYHPQLLKKRKNISTIKNNGLSKGIHHTWGSWREKLSGAYLKYKLNKWGMKLKKFFLQAKSG